MGHMGHMGPHAHARPAHVSRLEPVYSVEPNTQLFGAESGALGNRV
jgi:hypothetical protein